MKGSMHVLRWTFTFLRTSGCSPPSSWTSPCKMFLYNTYTVFAFLLLHSLLLCQLLDLVFNVDSQNDFSDNFYLSVGIFISCCKMWTLLVKREDFATLIDALRKEPFLPVGANEIAIRSKFNKFAEWNAIVYAILLESCVICMFGMSAFTDFENRTLKLRVWIPYDYSSPLLFTLTYAHQIASLTFCAFLNTAWDSLFSGLLIHTYCQLEMLGCRLKNIVKDEKILVKQCARHHEYIYRFATMVNSTFEIIMLLQFLVSTSILCFNLYRFTQKELDSRCMEMVFYAICTITQIFYYCWYGNEVEAKSLEIPDVIFESNWISLNNNTRRILLMIMRRATMPIKFTSAHIVSMNLDSFKTVLKTSYSAFNLLQHGQG